MKRSEVYTMLSAVGIPCAYHHFAEGSGQQPPFICFYYDSSADLMADNSNYRRIDSLTVELYTDNKDFVLEGITEAALTNAGLPWTKAEDYIDSEKMYMIVYTTEVIIDPEEEALS